MILAAIGCVAASVSAGPASAEADKRVALVIGNAAYRDAPLKNPVNDARAVAAKLRELGFQVIARENATREAMGAALGELTGKLSPGSVALIYYAGHGIQSRGRNYLIPVDVSLKTEGELGFQAVDVGLLTAELEQAQTRVSLVILDACRNNPFERRMRGASHGLAAVDAAQGTLIAYATAPGSVAADGDGANGVYTTALLRALSIPNLKAEEVFKRVRIEVAERTKKQQTPWESSSLTGDFYFLPMSGAPEAGPASTGAAKNDDAAVELTFWNTVKDSRDPNDFREYLRQFPRGRFVGLAKNRLASLETPPRQTPPTVSPAGPAPTPLSAEPRSEQVAAALARKPEGISRFDGVWKGSTYTCVVGTPNPVELTITNGVMKGVYERPLGPPRELTGTVDEIGRAKGTGVDAQFEGEIKDDKLTGTFDVFNLPLIKQCRGSFHLTHQP